LTATILACFVRFRAKDFVLIGIIKQGEAIAPTIASP
jgi:hypothetical protein